MAATMGQKRESGCKNSGRTGGAAVRPKVDTMVWSKSFGVSDMRDKQGVPCNLPEALLRNPNCWPLGTRTSRGGCPVQSTPRRGRRHQVPVVDQANTWSSQVVLRCWSAILAVVVVVAAAEEAAAESQISNLKSQSSQAIGGGSVLLLLLFLPPLWVCVSAARKGGLQTIQAENSNLGVDCCTCWFCLQLCWKQDELVTYYSGGIGQKSTNALPSGEKCCSGLGRCHTHKQIHTHTGTDKIKSRR